MNVELHNKVSGRFQLQVFRNGELRFDSGEQSNKILNGFFENAPNTRLRAFCSVGTGNEEPVGGDVNLRGARLGAPKQAETATVQTVVPISATSKAWEEKRQYIFPLGSIVGTISEVLLHPQPVVGGNDRALIRALTKNNLGIPTSVTLTAEDQLIIYHTLRLTVTDVTSTSNTVIFEGTTYNLKHRFMSDQAIAAATGSWVELLILSGGTAWCFARVYATSNADYAAGTFTATGGVQSAEPITSVANVPSLVGDTYTHSTVVTIPANTMVRNDNKAYLFTSYFGGSNYANAVFFSPTLNKTNLMQLKFNFTVTITRD